MNNDFWTTLFILLLCAPLAIKGINRWEKARKEEALKESNPEMWLRIKQMENDQQRQQHDKRKMGVQVGTTIASFLLRIFQR